MESDDERAAVFELAFRQATAAHKAGDLARAEQAYARLIAAAPGFLPLIRNLALLLQSQARWTEAEAVLARGVAARPDDPELAYSLGLSCLASGRYREGWALYEARYDPRRGPSVDPVVTPALSFPQWRGEPVRSLLVWGEQGFGDQIMFARYVPLLKGRGIAVTLVCKPALASLFQALGVPIIPAVGEADIPRHDAWVLMGSLPLHFGTLADAPPPPARLGQQQIDRRGVGVATTGRPTHPNDANRSLPPAAAASLLALGRDLSPTATGARDFRDTAEIVAGLALVVTVDTSVAHLAGSLGVPVWILLPAKGVDWRWMRERDDSPWYPTARLFRQALEGDWQDVLQRVVSALDGELMTTRDGATRA
jgi:hypothetical protein